MVVVGRVTVDILLNEAPLTAPSQTRCRQLWTAAAFGLGCVASVVTKVFCTRIHAIAQLGLSLFAGGSAQGLMNSLLPVKWLRIQQQELFRLSGTAYFTAVQVYINTESKEIQEAALQCSAALLGLQLAALINAYWNHHAHRFSLLAESQTPLLVNDVQNERTTLSLFCHSSRTQCISHVAILAIGAACLSLSLYVVSPDEREALKFVGAFALCFTGGSLAGYQAEHTCNRLEREFDREQEMAAEQEFLSTPSPSLKLQALRFSCKSLRIVGPLAIGRSFKNPCWQTAIPIGITTGALEQSFAYTFTHTPIDRFFDTHRIALQNWEKVGLRVWKYFRIIAEQVALLWFTYRVMTDPDSTDVDRIVFGQFPLFYWLSYGCSSYVNRHFNPQTSSRSMTCFFYRTVYKSDLFVYPFLYILNAGIKIGDESLQKSSLRDVAIPCVGWASLGMGLGFQAGSTSSLAIGPELPKMPLSGLVLLAEWSANSV